MQTENIISFTEAAKKHIQSFMADSQGGFRIGVKKTGCSGYAYLVDIVETPKENDLTFQMDDILVFLANDCVDLIKGTEIDFVDKGTGQKQLAFNNPNAEDYCGCGESFTIKG